MDGVLLLDKMTGFTSFDVVRNLRRILGVKRVGHAGTLDPLATGLLVLLIGKYCKLSDVFLGADKTYLARIKFGEGTDTDDHDGAIIARRSPDLLKYEGVVEALQRFLGEISQVPPNYSAVKVRGVRSYKMARQGNAIKLAPRYVCIHEIKCLHFKNPYLELRIRCSKGTYIRALARDLGVVLDVPAHVVSLRRIASGDFSVKDSVPHDSLEDFENIAKKILKGLTLFRQWHAIEIDEIERKKLWWGQKLSLPDFDTRRKIVLHHNGEIEALIYEKSGERRLRRF